MTTLTTLIGGTVGADEIAAVLGWQRPHFLRKVSRLIETEGMPSRIPGSSRKGGRWSRPAIEAWLRTYSDRKRAAERDERQDAAVYADRTNLYLAYVRPTGPRLAVDNTGVRI